jgi:electron transfer flavoprotein-quinone oxidoreductase
VGGGYTKPEFDAIVVGAGIAGCSCGYKLARAGLRVLVVERGKFSGAKNMWGGAFYGPSLAELFPNLWNEAPIERYVARRKFSLLTSDSHLLLEYSTDKFGQQPYNGFILLRSKFDRWLATRVEKAGAIIATGLQADDLIWDGNRVVGIKAGGDELPASVVIACDGVNSLLAQKAGLRKEFIPHDIKQGIKEVIALPQEIIDQRFNLSGSEGIAWEFIGSCTRGLPGGGFIYTNKESISIGVVAQLKALIDKRIKANDLLEDFKKHPIIEKLLMGGKLLEYSAHLIPVSGINMMPKVYTNGFLVAGDAASLVMGTGLILEGANYAIASGISAAEAVIRAQEKRDFSADSLDYYQKLLMKSFVLKDLKTFRKAPHFLENERIYSLYPNLACDLLGKILFNDGQPREKTWQLFTRSMKGKISMWQLVWDLVQGKRAL